MHVGEVFLKRMLRFSTLDALVGVDHVTTLGWRFIDVGSESWTTRFNQFKFNNAVKGGIAAVHYALGGAGALSRVRVKQGGERPVVMSLLPHDDTKLLSTDRLWELGEAVAQAVNIEWVPEALSQIPHKKLSRMEGADNRDEEIEGKYSCQTLDRLSCVILVDDFVTRGSTMSEAARAIAEANPLVQKVTGFALAKNERQSYAESQGISIGNSHIPSSIADAWDAA